MNKETICGIKTADIKKAYFNKKMAKIFTDIQAEGDASEEELNKLNDFLTELRKSEKSFTEKVIDMFGGSIVSEEPKPPTTEELYSQLPEEDLKTWKENVANAYNTIGKIRSEVAFRSAEHKQIKNEELYDYAIVMETLKRWIGQDTVYKKQLLKKRATEIIDNTGVSRKEAEDRSEISKEYSDYKNARNEFDSVSELVLIYKKRAGRE